MYTTIACEPNQMSTFQFNINAPTGRTKSRKEFIFRGSPLWMKFESRYVFFSIRNLLSKIFKRVYLRHQQSCFYRYILQVFLKHIVL